LRLLRQVFLISSILLFAHVAVAQGKHEIPIPIQDTSASKKAPSKPEEPMGQMDIVDLWRTIRKKQSTRKIDTAEKKSTKVRYTGIPAAGYTLQTGFAGLLSGNAAFYTDTNKSQNESVILSSVTYSQYKQIIFPLQINLWTKGNKYNFVTDYRYLKYPSFTYGLGGYTTLNDGYEIDYSALRLHQTLYKYFTHNLYLGLGYNYDYFWNVKEVNPPAGKVTDFEEYDNNGKTVNKTESASGVTFNFLHDSRSNPINPISGDFINIVYRPNPVFMGNNTSWQSLIFDLRKYIKLSPESNNVLAFWSYDWLTLSGNPPYLLLPNTGGDPYSNTGRGYIQGRFRGKDMLYVEGEYRFAITRNGLLGGVLFANAESFSEQTAPNFSVISPGYGAGIRIKLNKFSGTNLGLDYGFGANGSGGFFVNLGEVF
jgi:hypothetical protein